MISYRKMNGGDITAGLSLCRAAGWNQLARDWQLFLQSNPDGCFVGVNGQAEVAGTVTTVRYEDRFSWVGMVLVDPAQRRQGIGNGLMQRALESLSDQETVKLDATPAGREVYLKLGFKDEYGLTLMRLGKADHDRLPTSTARRMSKADIHEVLRFDRDVFGADRRFILEWLHDGAPELAFVTTDSDVITGYCFGRYGHNFTQIGPIIATNIDHALQLVAAAIRNAADRPVIIGVLNHTPAWIDTIQNLGFVEHRQLIRMYRGPNAFPGQPHKQFAIAGPEYG